MYEHDRSASKGHLAVREPVFAFKRVGRDTNPEQRARQAMLGCAPAHRLFGLAGVARREGVVGPRSLEDYRLTSKRASFRRECGPGSLRIDPAAAPNSRGMHPRREPPWLTGSPLHAGPRVETSCVLCYR